MRTAISVIFVMALMFSLAACGAKESNEATSAEGSTNTRQMPLTTRLVIGTLRLEATADSVTSEQAVELVPLWKGYVALSESDSASREELNALAEQIAENMTDEQMSFIDELDGASLDMAALMEELGIEMPAMAREGDEGGQRVRPGDGVPGIGPGGGQANPEQISPEQIETLRAERQAAGGGMAGGGLITPLVEKLVEILSAKI